MPDKTYEVDIVGGFNVQASTSFDNQKSINLYPMTDTVKKVSFMVPTSGTLTVDTFTDAGSDAVGRASFTSGILEYQVVGDTVFSVNASGVKETLGTMSSTTGYVGITASATEVMFVDGSQGYIYTISSGSFDIIDRTNPDSAGFPNNPIDCVFISGFFFVVIADDTRFFQSSPDQATFWDAENFALANATGDFPVCCRSLDGRLWIMSNYSMSIWVNQGEAGFSFRQDQTLLYDFGSYSAKSTVCIGGVMIFLARTPSGVGSVYLTKGGEPKPVSTLSVDNFLSSKDLSIALADFEAFIFKENGQVFWQCSSTQGNFTICYNSANSSWFTRQMYDGTRHIATSYSFFNGKPHILSYANNNLYEMSQYLVTDDQFPIYRARQTTNFSLPSYKRCMLKVLESNFQSGVGITGDINFASTLYVPGSDPMCYMSISRDGGTVFGNSRPAPMGRVGEFDARTVWRKMGISGKKGQVCFLFETFDPVVVFAMGALLTYEEQIA